MASSSHLLYTVYGYETFVTCLQSMCWTHESDEIIKDTLNRINVTLTTLKNIYLLKLHIFATIPRFAQLFKLVFCNELPPDISEEDEN